MRMRVTLGACHVAAMRNVELRILQQELLDLIIKKKDTLQNSAL